MKAKLRYPKNSSEPTIQAQAQHMEKIRPALRAAFALWAMIKKSLLTPNQLTRIRRVTMSDTIISQRTICSGGSAPSYNLSQRNSLKEKRYMAYPLYWCAKRSRQVKSVSKVSVDCVLMFISACRIPFTPIVFSYSAAEAPEANFIDSLELWIFMQTP